MLMVGLGCSTEHISGDARIEIYVFSRHLKHKVSLQMIFFRSRTLFSEFLHSEEGILLTLTTRYRLPTE